MYKKLGLLSLSLSLITGCAQVPMADKNASNKAKLFEKPAAGYSGIYVYRLGGPGTALKKDVHINGNCLGETAPYMFFYEQVPAGKQYKISTESEFSANDIYLNARDQEIYYIKQYMKMGLFVGGADLLEVNEHTGKADVMSVELAKKGICSDTDTTKTVLINPVGYKKQEGISNENGTAPSPMPVNVSTNRYDVNTPNFVYDNDFQTRWSAKGNNASLQVDYGKSIEFNAVRMAFYKGSQRISIFDIEVSENGKDWIKVINRGESSGSSTSFERFPFSTVKARYIKYVGHGNTMNSWSSLTEFKAVDCKVNTCPESEL